MALTDYELTPAARRTLNLFLMIDVSGSMAGEKIEIGRASCRERV